ncbi:MAG: PAS domain-containing sensor histidine kinase [Halobacteriales archaeon]|nr:PAS domain-containing sensor histidine kinase [Halobacteriales archaeon]
MRRLLEPLADSGGRIAGIYLLFGVVWIVVTDGVAGRFAESAAELSRLQTLKGWLFVLASAALIFGLVRINERRVAAERDFTELALDSLRDVFVVIDAAGVIQRVNNEAVEVTGYDESELLGMEAVEAFGIEDRERVDIGITDALEGSESPVRATLITKGGIRIQYEFRGRPMVEETGEMRGLVVIGRDVSDQVLNEQRLGVALRMLRHNLRNDLNVIRGWAESLGDGADPAKVRRKVTDTVDKLLSMSEKTRRMAELGEPVQGEPREVDVVDMVRSIAEEIEADHPAATLELALPEGPMPVRVPGYQLETAVRNALENAIEHNPAAEPWARVAVRLESDRRSIVIEDDGPGLPANERLVFEEGYETPLEHGSGVGLWTIQWCLRDLGGSVELRDREPAGTAVSLELPAPTAAS